MSSPSPHPSSSNRTVARGRHPSEFSHGLVASGPGGSLWEEGLGLRTDAGEAEESQRWLLAGWGGVS